MLGSDTNAATIALLREALAAGTTNELAKATFVQPSNATTGLQDYDLEAAAKTLYPVLTPLRNRIPRTSGKGGIQANWRGVVGLDTGMVYAGVPEGRRGAVISMQTKDYMAAYRTIGTEGTVTEEAQLAAGDFDDLKSRTSMSTLQACMIAEERLILAGNTTYPLGAAGAPTLTTSTTGGALAATTAVSVIVVPLTLNGKLRASVATGVVQTASQASADGGSNITFNGGAGVKSTNTSITTGSGSANSVTATAAAVRGAFGYAFYWGAAGSEVLGAITTFPQAVITAAATGTQTAASLGGGDYSTNTLEFDGLLSMASASSNGGYYYSAAPGAGLTADNVGGVVEFDNALQWFWDNLRLSPDTLWVSSQEMIFIRRKVLTGNSASNARFTFTVNPGQITGGGMPKGYLNPFAAGGAPAEIPIEIHPYLPAGTCLFTTSSLPYPMNNIDGVMKIRCRKDYYQREWPQRTRQLEYGVYSDQVFQHYFTPSLGLITGLSAV
jgi:hypothetical protein